MYNILFIATRPFLVIDRVLLEDAHLLPNKQPNLDDSEVSLRICLTPGVSPVIKKL